MSDQYIQVGVTALRGPDGTLLPSVPLYVRATPEAQAAQEKLAVDFTAVMARRMDAYIRAGGQIGRQRKARKAASPASEETEAKMTRKLQRLLNKEDT